MINSGSSRAASSGYLISLALGCVGIALFGITLDEFLQPQSADVGGAGGISSEILAFGILYSIRLIFWSKIPFIMQNLVRTCVTMTMILSVVANFSLLGLTLFGPTQRSESIGPLYFTIIGALSQISTIIWLVKYRHE